MVSVGAVLVLVGVAVEAGPGLLTLGASETLLLQEPEN